MKMSEVIICPACGFSFRSLSTKNENDRTVCPMCGHEISDPDILPFPLKEDGKKFV